MNPNTVPRDEFLALRRRWDRCHAVRNLLNVTGLVLAILGTLPSTEPEG